MVKEKQTRTYDKDGFRKRAACLCVRDPEEREVLILIFLIYISIYLIK